MLSIVSSESSKKNSDLSELHRSFFYSACSDTLSTKVLVRCGYALLYLWFAKGTWFMGLIWKCFCYFVTLFEFSFFFFSLFLYGTIPIFFFLFFFLLLLAYECPSLPLLDLTILGVQAVGNCLCIVFLWVYIGHKMLGPGGAVQMWLPLVG